MRKAVARLKTLANTEEDFPYPDKVQKKGTWITIKFHGVDVEDLEKIQRVLNAEGITKYQVKTNEQGGGGRTWTNTLINIPYEQ